MRFACQSCGKAYSLPEEKIADKSNVKLKCRVCGAIVEVKRQGDLVAHVLDEGDAKRGRVSEAPAPLTTISPEDEESDDGATVSISESSLNGTGPLQFELPSAPALPQVAASFAMGASAAPSPVPGSPPSSIPPAPGFSPSSLPPPPLVRPETNLSLESLPPPLELGLAPPPIPAPGLGALPLPAASFASALPMASPPPLDPVPPPLQMDGPPALNGKNGMGTPYAMAQIESPRDLPEDLVSPVAAGAFSSTTPGVATLGHLPSPPEAPALPSGVRDDTIKKMIAAFLTGVLVDRLIAGLFF
ncbi:MAG TPA: zinc-ribbon domain-containing protein [Polyangiaceae bacterium]|nr:zinc-ribbon domain-containing protein [Polyangiaceae bacterium]